MYQNLEDDASVNEKSLWQHEFCAKELSSGRKFYSKGRALIFEFHAGTQPYRDRTNKGFIGEYRFLEKSTLFNIFFVYKNSYFYKAQFSKVK